MQIEEVWGEDFIVLAKRDREWMEHLKSLTESLIKLVYFKENERIECFNHASYWFFDRRKGKSGENESNFGDLLLTTERLLFAAFPAVETGWLSKERFGERLGLSKERFWVNRYIDLAVNMPYDDIRSISTTIDKKKKINRLEVKPFDISKYKVLYPNDSSAAALIFYFTTEDHAREGYIILGKMMDMYKERKTKEERKLEVTKYEVTYDVAKLVESKLFEFGEDGGLLTHCPYCKTKNSQAGKEKIVECSGCGEKYIAPKKILELL